MPNISLIENEIEIAKNLYQKKFFLALVNVNADVLNLIFIRIQAQKHLYAPLDARIIIVV